MNITLEDIDNTKSTIKNFKHLTFLKHSDQRLDQSNKHQTDEDVSF